MKGFWNPLTGRNRIAHLSAAMTGTLVAVDKVQDNSIARTAINGNVYQQIAVGDVDADDFDDLFFWDPRQGRNRLFTTDATGGLLTLLDNPVSPPAINGDGSGLLTTLSPDPLRSPLADDLFFWPPNIGQNRRARTTG